tara:strand:+ start:1079 stop:1459 length:381 start_codon:yes stop_codon:yes gene_type:complete
MAITNKGTRNLLRKEQIPTNYTLPTVVTFLDPGYCRTLTLSISKSDVVLGTASGTMESIIDDAAVGIEKQVYDIIAGDFVTSNNVEFYTDLTTITSTVTSNGGNDAWLTNAATEYEVKVQVYIKTS